MMVVALMHVELMVCDDQEQEGESVSQSGLYALQASPFRAQTLNFTYIACSLPAKSKNILTCCLQSS